MSSSGKKATRQRRTSKRFMRFVMTALMTFVLNLARWSEEITRGRDAGPDQAVVYYREQEGRGALKAYYTSDLQVIGVGP